MHCQNDMLFDQTKPAHTPETAHSRITARATSLLSYAAILALISASTATMMLCPCDSVGFHDPYAVSLVGIAALFGIAAAFLIYRRMRRDAGATAFLRAVGALAIVGVAVFAELSAAMYVVAWLARPR